MGIACLRGYSIGAGKCAADVFGECGSLHVSDHLIALTLHAAAVKKDNGWRSENTEAL